MPGTSTRSPRERLAMDRLRATSFRRPSWPSGIGPSCSTRRGSLRGWLLAIARNRAIDHLRYARRHDRAVAFSALGTADQDDSSLAEWLTGSGVLISTGAPDPGPETAVIDLETRAFVADAIASLAPVERSVIQLAYGAHLSQVEIAARLGWPLGTVKTRTRRALRHLRDRLVPPSTAADPLDAAPPRSGTCVPA